jgi:Heavy metal binding domain
MSATYLLVVKRRRRGVHGEMPNRRRTEVKRTLIIATLLAAVVTGMAAFAHGGHDHIMGTVTRAEKGRIEVKGADGKNVAVAVTPATVYTKGKESAALADVKPGVRVAIEAMKGKEGLEAMEVKIGTAEVIYTCPMHPEVQQTKPGKCPKCGMNLEKKG